MSNSPMLEFLSRLPVEARERFVEAINATPESKAGIAPMYTVVQMDDLDEIVENLALDCFISAPNRARLIVDVISELGRDRLVQWMVIAQVLSRESRCPVATLVVSLSPEIAEQALEGVHTHTDTWRPYVIGPEPFPHQIESIYSTDHPLYDSRIALVRESTKRLAKKRGIIIDAGSRTRLKQEADLRTLELWLLSVVAMEEPGTLSFVEC